MTHGEAGKGHAPRPFSTTREERELRAAYMYGEITLEEFDRRYKELQKQGKIVRK